MTGEILWLGAEDARWDSLLEQTAAHDIYCLPAWHALAAANGEGEPRLFVYREGPSFIALPLLVRPIEGREDLSDATSVYGYVGPLVSASPAPPALIAHFQQMLAATAREQRLVTVFARLHPLLDQVPLLEGLGELHAHGSTVSIDLTLPLESQLAAYRSNHRRDLTKLEKIGFACCLDDEFYYLEKFIDIYYENMRRIGASSYYFFKRSYFWRLRERLGRHLLLFVCRRGAEFAGGALFTFMGGIAQYHLGAISTAHLRFAPLKQLLDAARAHLAGRGAAVLHLGGGLGGARDSLFHFKAGFSDRRHSFLTWRWVVDPEAYKQLSAAQGREPVAGFFPAYRIRSALYLGVTP
jgi:Acetyltransferase (GNAT) domain